MGIIRRTLDAAVAAFELAGVDTVTDPRNINPPAVFVSVPVIEPALCGQTGIGSVTVYLIVPDAGNDASIDALDVLLDKLAGAGLLSDRLESDTVSVPGAPDGLPAYRYNLDLALA